MFERARKINSFIGERTVLAMDTCIDIVNATVESIAPLEQHAPKIVTRFLEGQKSLFQKRSNIRDSLLSK